MIHALFRPVYFYLFGRNGTGIVQIVLGKVRKFRAVLNFRTILNISFEINDFYSCEKILVKLPNLSSIDINL